MSAPSPSSDRGFAGPLEPVDDCTYRIPKLYKPGKRVDGLIFADDRLLPLLKSDRAAEQEANVAFLPGIVRASLAMPDIHWGYGFCIGGVGYDINCGVRLARTNLSLAEVEPVLPQLVNQLIRDVPVGVGQGGKYYFDPEDLRKLMKQGVPFPADRGVIAKSRSREGLAEEQPAAYKMSMWWSTSSTGPACR